MPKFSQRSLDNLSRAHPLLQKAAHETIKGFDFTVICSTRNKADQEKAFRDGVSNAHYLQSPHNYTPSLAIDIVPWPLDWKDLKAFETMGAHFMATVKKLGLPIRWGADWNRNGSTKDESFVDRPHFELHPWKNYIDRNK